MTDDETERDLYRPPERKKLKVHNEEMRRKLRPTEPPLEDDDA